MGHAFFQNNGIGEVVYAYTMSDWLGKSICVLLGMISVGICTLVVEKILSLRGALKNSEAFLDGFLNAGNLFEMRKAAKRRPGERTALLRITMQKTAGKVQTRPEKAAKKLSRRWIRGMTLWMRSVKKAIFR